MVYFGGGGSARTESNRRVMERHCAKYELERVKTVCEVHNGNQFHTFVARTHCNR